VLTRDDAPLTADTCGVFPGTYPTTVTLAGGLDTSVAGGNCYRYRYTVSDHVGNTIATTSASVAKIAPPSPG
jgi:hypothetical protein